MDKKSQKQAEKIIKEFFEKMGFEVEIDSQELIDNTLSFNLLAKEPQIIIGEKGKTLIEIQKVLGKMLRKKLEEQVYLDLDINQYKKNKTKYLKELAQELANRVALEKRERPLFPMSAYERRIIHTELAGREDVTTESRGEGLERRVVIKPA